MKVSDRASQAVGNYRVVASKNDKRKDVFCVLLKRTYDLRHGQVAARAEKDRPLDLVDVYNGSGDPETCSVRLENDLSPFKPATDVVVDGTVYAPGGRPVQSLDTGIEVAGKLKRIRVLGNRSCIYRRGLAPETTEPEPFTEMPLCYERAYGGTDIQSIPVMPYSYPRNHLGRGFVLKNLPEIVDGLCLPNFEDPSDLLTPDRIVVGEPENWHQQPLPQGFGWFAKVWYPRCSFVGSVPGFVDPDVVLKEEILGLVPQRHIALARQFKLPSYDVRFNSGASHGLIFPFLRGGETIRLAHLTPEGLLQFTLPIDTPQMGLDIGLGQRDLEPVLHTVLIRANDLQLDLVWRGAHEYPGIDWLPEMSRLQVEIAA